MCIPDEEGSCYQHHGKIDSHSSLEVEVLELGGGVADEEKEDGGKIGGQELVYYSSLESDLHLYAFIRIS